MVGVNELLPGMKVLVKDGRMWFSATIKSKNPEPKSYTLITPNGHEIQRNRKFLKELTGNASQKFTFRSLPDDDPQIILDKPKPCPKAVNFDEHRNVMHIIPSKESSAPKSPDMNPTTTASGGRPKRIIKKPIRYREDI